MSEIYCQYCRLHKKPECFPDPSESQSRMKHCKVCIEKTKKRNTFPSGIKLTDETKIAVNKKRSASRFARFDAFLKKI